MGYSTEFTGHVTVTPPLNGPEMDYLSRFANSRRFARTDGPYQTGTDDYRGPGTVDYNTPPAGQHSLWCDWEPTQDGTGIAWNGVEKFHYGDQWMTYLIDTFLKPDATLLAEHAAPIEGRFYDSAFQHFTFNHIVSGRIEAQGDSPDDRWTLLVEDNIVSKVPYPTLAERMKSTPDLAAAFEVLKAAGVTVEQYARQTGQDY